MVFTGAPINQGTFMRTIRFFKVGSYGSSIPAHVGNIWYYIFICDHIWKLQASVYLYKITPLQEKVSCFLLVIACLCCTDLLWGAVSAHVGLWAT